MPADAGAVTFEQLISQQRPYVEQVARDLVRRQYLSAAEAEEFLARVSAALERNDFEVLRTFDGRSSWETYLSMVVTHEFFAFQGKLWGQWRPSAAARRLGPAAVLLEELVGRDHMKIPAALEIMRATHRVDLPRTRLLQFARQLRLTRAAHASDAPGPTGAPLDAAEPAHAAALRDALTRLSADERLIVELRLRDGQPLTRIASALHLDVRPLQRQLEAAIDRLRQTLLDHGVTVADVAALLGDTGAASSSLQQRWWQAVAPRPSHK